MNDEDKSRVEMKELQWTLGWAALFAAIVWGML